MPSLAKTLLASSAIALGLLAVLGSAQAAEQSNTSAVTSAARKIEVIPFNAASSKQVVAAADQQAEAEVPAGGTADIRADASDAPADASPGASQDGPPAAAALASTETGPSRVEPKFISADEAKRLNRQRYIERYEARFDSEPSYNERYVEPRYNERYVEPRYVEPRYKERYVEPRYVAPRYVAPQYVAPLYVAPQYVAPRHYVQHDTYAHRYQAAPNYGHTQRRVEYRSSRGY